jgi:hypothetical protein
MLLRLALVPIFLAGTVAMARPVAPSAHTSGHTYVVPLSGGAEVVSGIEGDIDGSGTVELTVDTASKQICYDFSVSGVATPLMAHIHRGSKYDNGPSVVTLLTGPGAEMQNCVPWTEKWLSEIVAHPNDFYVNLYTTEYPDGALRGQLG